MRADALGVQLPERASELDRLRARKRRGWIRPQRGADQRLRLVQRLVPGELVGRGAALRSGSTTRSSVARRTGLSQSQPPSTSGWPGEDA